MKRGAERYLNKDNADDDEVEDAPTEEFRMADDTVLASRPMRRLPKRSLAGNNAPAAPISEASSAPAPKFTGFSGFEYPSSSTPPLSGTTSQPSFSKPASSAPTVAPTASNTAKTFASFLNPPSSKPEPIPSQPASHVAPPSSEATDVDDPTLLKYYTSLRGLNVSFLDALSKATEEDPFADISDLLDRYKSLRLNVQKEFDEKSKTTSEPVVAAPKPTSMPAPPISFAGFGKPSPSTGSNGGGFQPKLTSSSSTPASGFSFKPSTSSTSTSTSAFSFAAPPTVQSSTSTKPFALTPGSGSPSPFSGSASNSPSPFGATDKSSSSPSPFSFGGPPVPSATNTNTEKSALSSSPFGSGTPSGSSTTGSAFGTTEKSASSSASFTFGMPSASNTSTSAFGIPGSSSGSNVFGSDKPSFSTSPPTAAKTPTFGGFGGFGKPGGGSIGNPVGFGFGSPPKTPGGEVGVNGGSSSSEAAGEKSNEEVTAESQEDGKADKVPTFGMNTKSPHDEEGEGEELEETMHSVKLKAFRLRKAAESGGAAWLELGFGVLRLKKHRETEARRVLLRNSSTGKINLNFNLYSGLKATQTKKTLTFIGHDETGASQTYSVRLQNEDQAKTLKEALDREIAFVKAKSED
ncbi:hypothetical protein D9615_004630 [Tricholomella constricta]|uniref:RanBD1 domain-containing protein n=1 Tax=Tricholomella constricta TaxID=117010 RepID=A0A8H5HCP6_9AGAR|nr:hypothetical protein D9615_004630 [Tricholomella constricta]